MKLLAIARALLNAHEIQSVIIKKEENEWAISVVFIGGNGVLIYFDSEEDAINAIKYIEENVK